MTSSRSLAVVCAGVAALTSVGGTVADVPADNVALEYVGSFEGAPARSAVSVTLFATADAGSAFCGPVSAEVTGTRFKAALPPECAVGIRGSAPAFVQVAVAGINVERVPLRSVPYAIEAGRAQAASDSVANSTLRRELDRLLRPRICGVTSARDGAWGGYSVVTTACRTSAGCSSNALLCTADQVLRFLSLNAGRSLPVDQGWVATGLQVNSPSDLISNDCNGFNTASGNARGMTFNQVGQPPQPAYLTCATALPAYCCD